ncbi:hypothetical protein DSCW_12770 [Desulfosarcina widdelii]|uniref:Uncharacterized protein n=1 Tax=Desulfosarcina widdelii TaxID=947919 RepID=A0A5K7YZP8_9BACT|nr:hypothetical protein [Desulfosarcina widdelii]BBO73860.1 hypothetical protein DSCW_12770 [Desulfosarcina widdelii]
MSNNQTPSKSDSDQEQPVFVPDLFKGAVNGDGTVNMRSTWGRSIRAVKDALKDDQFEAARAILEDQIAQTMTLERAIMEFMLGNPAAFFVDGKLNEMISKDLMNFQEQTRKALYLLLDLDRKKKITQPKGSAGRDLSAISFD